MEIKLHKSKIEKHHSTITITGSKSETNRLLLLQALYPNINLVNTSVSDDSEVMQNAIQQTAGNKNSLQTIDIHHAGTAMRFLTAYFAVLENSEVILTGSKRMKERPILKLVDALKQLGAEISYEESEGFPPLRIKGSKLTLNKVTLEANISSQYISALLLIAPKLKNGLEITLLGEITSIPYIRMTLALLNQIGVQTSFEANVIKVQPLPDISHSITVTIESDWSSASYWYSITALSEVGTKFTLLSYKKNSIQGDSALAEIYQDFGVETIYNDNDSITISKLKDCQLSSVSYQLNNCPDIAQTIALTCFGLGIGCDLSGLHTLKIKETDRLEALNKELTKLGAEISTTNDSLHLKPRKAIKENVQIATYQDHRMAMAFSVLALKTSLTIENAAVVSKSYPTFWNDLKTVGFQMEKN